MSENNGPRPFGPALWCGQHDRWEHPAGACDGAFDPDDVDWLKPSGGEIA